MKRINRWFNGAAAIILAASMCAITASAIVRHSQRRAAAEAAEAAQQERLEQERQRVASLVRPHNPQAVSSRVGMPSQGPIIVNTGVDGNEDPSGAWTNPANAGSASSSSVALATAGTSPTLNTNTLKCQFNAASFSLPAGITVNGITLLFRAWSSGGMGSPIVNVESVKTSLTTSNFTDNATLTSTDQAFSYIVTDPMPSAAVIEGAWEIDLAFSSPTSADFGDVHVYDVAATIFYTTPGGNAGQLRKRILLAMGQLLKQNQSAEPLLFFMADSSDHLTGLTGLTPTVKLGKPGGVGAAPAGTVSEVDATNLPGWYQVAGNATDCDTLGPLILKASGTGADDWEDRHQVIAHDPRDTTLAANLKAIYDSAIISGTVNAVTDSGNFTLTSSGLSTNDNDYNNLLLVFTSGSNQRISRVIGAYTGASKQVQFLGTGYKGAFPETVAPGDSWLMLAGSP